MKKLGIYICSYNGRNDTIRCLHTLEKQTFDQFDVCVIDNASTDGTYEAVSFEFGNSVRIIRNDENLGGAGGFETGIQDGLERGYQFIGLMDNDILVDEHAVEEMLSTIEADDRLGAVGAKVLYMDKPGIIFDFVNVIDIKHQQSSSIYRDVYDAEKFDIILDSDYVPATAALFRREALLESGTMPVDNFIYYDDIEMGYRLKLHGWKIVYDGKAKVSHKSGNLNRVKDNFADYYFTRNSLKFWFKYMEQGDIEPYLDSLMNKIFIQLYGCAFKNQMNKFFRLWYPFSDFIHNVRGKADNSRILQIKDEPDIQLIRLCKNKRLIRISIDESAKKPKMLMRFIEKMRIISGDIRVIIYAENTLDIGHLPLRQNVEWNFAEPDKLIAVDELELSCVDTEIRYIGHVLDFVDRCILPDVYVDCYHNVLANDEAYEYFRNYEKTKKDFMDLYKTRAMETIAKIRK